MIISAISIVGVISGLLFGKGRYDTFFPVHVSTGSAVISGIIAIILLCVYFYFSYQLLLGTQSVSIYLLRNESLTDASSWIFRGTHLKCSAISSSMASLLFSSSSACSATLHRLSPLSSTLISGSASTRCTSEQAELASYNSLLSYINIHISRVFSISNSKCLINIFIWFCWISLCRNDRRWKIIFFAINSFLLLTRLLQNDQIKSLLKASRILIRKCDW